jgi:hypothetical protein
VATPPPPPPPLHARSTVAAAAQLRRRTMSPPWTFALAAFIAVRQMDRLSVPDEARRGRQPSTRTSGRDKRPPPPARERERGCAMRPGARFGQAPRSFAAVSRIPAIVLSRRPPRSARAPKSAEDGRRRADPTSGHLRVHGVSWSERTASSAVTDSTWMQPVFDAGFDLVDLRGRGRPQRRPRPPTPARPRRPRGDPDRATPTESSVKRPADRGSDAPRHGSHQP